MLVSIKAGYLLLFHDCACGSPEGPHKTSPSAIGAPRTGKPSASNPIFFAFEYLSPQLPSGLGEEWYAIHVSVPSGLPKKLLCPVLYVPFAWLKCGPVLTQLLCSSVSPPTYSSKPKEYEGLTIALPSFGGRGQEMFFTDCENVGIFADAKGLQVFTRVVAETGVDKVGLVLDCQGCSVDRPGGCVDRAVEVEGIPWRSSTLQHLRMLD
jgi:hypothetical protein